LDPHPINMISIQPTLLALALASLLFDVGLGREQLGAVQTDGGKDPTRQYEFVTDAASCTAVGCREIKNKFECNEASQVIFKKAIVASSGTDSQWSKYPSYCFNQINGAFFNELSGPNSAPTVNNQAICNCPATAAPTPAPTETCEALQAACTKYNDKCGSTSGGSNSGGSNSGGSNSGGSNSGGSNSGGDSTSGGGGGGGGDTPVNKLITDVTIQIDNNPENPMVDLTGIYKLKEVEGWQKDGDCSAFKQDPAYLATELVKKLKDDLAKIGANVM